MIGMLQILTYLLGVYLVVKGIEVLQLAFCSPIQKKTGVLVLGFLTLALCVGAAGLFITMQDVQARASSSTPGPGGSNWGAPAPSPY